MSEEEEKVTLHDRAPVRTTSSVGRSKTKRKRKEEKDRNNKDDVLESLAKF